LAPSSMTSMLRMLMVGLGRAEPSSFYPRFIGSTFRFV